MTNTRMTYPEVLESRFPSWVDEFSIRRVSGGHGAWKGGDGITRKLIFLEPMTVTVLSSHRVTEPAVSMGGSAGKRGENMIARQGGALEKQHGNDAAQMSAGMHL